MTEITAAPSSSPAPPRSGDSRPRPPRLGAASIGAGLVRIVGLLVAAALLAACSSNPDIVPTGGPSTPSSLPVPAICGSHRSGPPVRLVLGDRGGGPTVTVAPGATVEAVVSFHGEKMSRPVLHGVTTAVCELEVTRAAGTLQVIYVAERPGRVGLSSVLEHPTATLDPIFSASIVVRRAAGTA